MTCSELERAGENPPGPEWSGCGCEPQLDEPIAAKERSNTWPGLWVLASLSYHFYIF